ncbi:unnamed protein product [Rotaria socialis]|uniref:Uncharacterized protein n=1 Tax=Rotaria socialis TaxID=392032 RepID=A0A821R3Z9_9BILA|nr:unnamed protein product [Rotaria socialis]
MRERCEDLDELKSQVATFFESQSASVYKREIEQLSTRSTKGKYSCKEEFEHLVSAYNCNSSILPQLIRVVSLVKLCVTRCKDL